MSTDSSAGATEPAEYSGQRVILLAGVALLVVMVLMALVFRDWRSRYRARAAFGANQVAPAIDPLADVVPAGVAPEAWRQAVADTHRALVAVTSANVLGLAEMRAFRADVAQRVARARPDTAREELAALWNDLATRAGPILNPERHPRPKLLPPRPEPKSAGK